MLNTEPIISQPRVTEGAALSPSCSMASSPAQVQLLAHFLPPVWPFVPMSSLSLHPMPASVSSYSDHTGPLLTTCPDHLAPLTSFALSHLPAWIIAFYDIPGQTRKQLFELRCHVFFPKLHGLTSQPHYSIESSLRRDCFPLTKRWRFIDTYSRTS